MGLTGACGDTLDGTPSTPPGGRGERGGLGDPQPQPNRASGKTSPAVDRENLTRDELALGKESAGGGDIRRPAGPT